MASSEPTSSVSVAQSARWRRYARFVIPHVLTIAISLLLFSLLHRWFWAVPLPVTPLIATVTPVPTIPPTPIPTPQPTPPSPPPSEGLLRLTILDLQAENAQLRTITHLLRAAITLDEALNALQRNDFAEADRALMMARRALDRAYNLSTEPQKGPIDAIRLQISQIRDDLGVRPEGADRRLWQVRRLILALVDERVLFSACRQAEVIAPRDLIPICSQQPCILVCRTLVRILHCVDERWCAPLAPPTPPASISTPSPRKRRGGREYPAHPSNRVWQESSAAETGAFSVSLGRYIGTPTQQTLQLLR